MFSEGLPGSLAGLGGFSFSVFTTSVYRVTGLLLPSDGLFVPYLCRGCSGGQPRMY